MKTALIFLTTGFEEIEALSPVDILRRGGVDVKTVSLEAEIQVIGAHNIPVKADVFFDEVKNQDVDMLILPGGSTRITQFSNLKEKISTSLNKGNSVAAICAAPMLLGQMGLLKDKKATCYPGFESYLEGANIVDKQVVVEGNIITAKGPAVAVEFALTLLEYLTDKNNRDKIAREIIYQQ
ncbi:MAG: DJ-1 family protein [Neisseriaceae bacterium]|nr:MAG: DJ-1 family protein [Neisseriaceae bacterium]